MHLLTRNDALHQTDLFELVLPSVNERTSIRVLDAEALIEAWERASADRIPPRLLISANLNDIAGDGDSVLDPEEASQISVIITNEGAGHAYGVRIAVDEQDLPDWITIGPAVSVGDIEPGDFRTVEIPINSTRAALGGWLVVELNTSEEGGFDAPPVRLAFETDQFRPTRLTPFGLSMREVTGNQNGLFEPNEVMSVQLGIRNDADLWSNTVVRFESASVGNIRGESEQRQRLEPADEQFFVFEYVLPQRDAPSDGVVRFEFSITDERTGSRQNYDSSVLVGSLADTIITSTRTAAYPTQRVLIGELSDDGERRLGDAMASFRENLLREGNLTIANEAEVQVYITNCLENSGVSPSYQRECELRWARQQSFDWLLSLDVEMRGRSEFDVFLEVLDPNTSETVGFMSQYVSRESDAREAMAALARSFNRWLSMRDW